MLKFIRKKRKAVSPVVATVMLIALVVVASAMVFFLVVPMLQGNADLDFLTAQWFDSDGDNVVDIVYLTVQNSGTAAASISNITINIRNGVNGTQVPLTNTELVGASFPLVLNTAERVDLSLTFNPTSEIDIGDNIFHIIIYYGDETFTIAPENLKHTDVISTLDLSILNPYNESWFKDVIDPQAVAIGGYNTSTVTYDFEYADGTDILMGQNITTNIDSTTYADDYGYRLTFYVDDSLGQSVETLHVIGIDNEGIDISLSLNETDINQGDAINASWVLTYAGAELLELNLVLSGDVYPTTSMDLEDLDTRSFVLSGASTRVMAEDDLTFTLYVKDEAGNADETFGIGGSFTLNDIYGPDMDIVTPFNESTGLGGLITFEVTAEDPSGIDDVKFDILFRSTTSAYTYLYSNFIEGEATFYESENKWILEFNSFLLPSDEYKVEITLYDQAGNGNMQYLILSFDNLIFEVTGVSKSDGGLFSAGLISFYLTNNIPYDVNISQFYIDWEPDNRADEMVQMTDNEGHIWLPNGNYDEEQYHILNSGDDVIIDAESTVYVTITLDNWNRISRATLEFRFILVGYAEQIFTGL